MTVEVDHSNRAVRTVNGSKQRKRDGMVATESDDPRQSLSLLGWSNFGGICDWCSRENVVVTLLDLSECELIVVTVIVNMVPSPTRPRETYDVTGISPQSRTVAQLLNGLVARGTLYPPLEFSCQCDF